MSTSLPLITLPRLDTPATIKEGVNSPQRRAVPTSSGRTCKANRHPKVNRINMTQSLSNQIKILQATHIVSRLWGFGMGVRGVSGQQPHAVTGPGASNHTTRAHMKLKIFPAFAFALFTAVLVPVALHAQEAGSAYALPSAAPATPAGANAEERGRALLDQMVQALGGSAWLNRVNLQADGRGTTFFHGEPNPYIIEFHQAIRYDRAATPPVLFTDRIGFLTDRGMVLPGKKIDVIQIMTAGHGYEITYKGKTELPKDQVDDYFRRRDHSLETVVQNWIHAPGVMIIYEGQKFIDRHMADQVSILSATNDAVTLAIDAATHLPIRRTFEYRDPQFHDFDEESETYDDYHVVQGINTPMTITRYHNGDMSGQRYFTKVTYNESLSPDLFNPDAVTPKLSKK